jgi:hypothetical protein
MDIPTKVNWALVVSVVTGLFGAFGGVPGIKGLFFSKPKVVLGHFVPVIVYDAGYSQESQFPKFQLNGVVRISNPNRFDITISEMKMYGRTKDSSGKWHKDGKPILYDLRLPCVVEPSVIIRALASELVRFSVAHFENDQEPGIMYGPLTGGASPEGNLVFVIYRPSLNQLFRYNSRRVPNELVPEAYDGSLTVAVALNNELVRVDRKRVTGLASLTPVEWGSAQAVASTYNVFTELTK